MHTPTPISNSLKFDLEHLIQLQRNGHLKEAIVFCQKLLKDNPHHPAVLYSAGNLALQQKKYNLALDYLSRALKGNSQNPLIYFQLGHTYNQLNKVDKAIESYEKALKKKPNWGETHYHLATLYSKKADYIKAEFHARGAIKCSTPQAGLHNTLGNILLLQGKEGEAISQYETALSLNPNYDGCYYNLGTAFRSKARFKKALFYFNKTIELNPKHLAAHHFIALLSYKLEDYEKALTHFKKASELDPENQVYIHDVANLYSKLKDFPKAIDYLESNIQKFPHHRELVEQLISAYREICDWEKQEYWTKYYLTLNEESKAQGLTFYDGNYIYLNVHPSMKLNYAKISAKRLCDKHKELIHQFNFKFNPQNKAKLRIGYVSADIKNHAVSHLIRNMFAYHTRERFEIFLYSIGADDNKSDYRAHIANLCDHFIDVFDKPSKNVIEKIFQDEIDILIDLMGYTARSRTEIFAAKPAPIQINYLGYPGTMGADFMDYIIADKVSIPIEHLDYYSEKPIYMPHTYFVTDNEQIIAADKYQRSDFNLPEQGFIFCSFNRANKIDAEVFSCWMRILQQVPNSVLWLISNNSVTRENLFKEAQKNHIERERLIFAKGLPKDKHLARLKLVDLFLDCFVYGAHTTAVDALWAGVPLITRLGDSITSRATGGILTAMELPELITESTEDYEKLAIYFAKNPEALYNLKVKIAQHRQTSPLFNTHQYVKYFEQGLEKAWSLYLEGKKPDVISVE